MIPDPDTDWQAVAVECAAKYKNVALGEDRYGTGPTTVEVTIEISNVFLPKLLEGEDVSHVQLRPSGDELMLWFTAAKP